MFSMCDTGVYTQYPLICSIAHAHTQEVCKLNVVDCKAAGGTVGSITSTACRERDTIKSNMLADENINTLFFSEFYFSARERQMGEWARYGTRTQRVDMYRRINQVNAHANVYVSNVCVYTGYQTCGRLGRGKGSTEKAIQEEVAGSQIRVVISPGGQKSCLFVCSWKCVFISLRVDVCSFVWCVCVCNARCCISVGLFQRLRPG